MDMTKGGAVGKPNISSMTSPTLAFTLDTVADSGDVFATPATVSLGDIRMSTGVLYYEPPVSNYTVNSIRVLNTTRFNDLAQNYTELITDPLQMDSVVDLVGLGELYMFFDNDSPMDDIDMGSTSGHPQAHNGTGNNTFKFVLIFEHSNYVGEKTVVSSFSLSDSDA